MPARPRPASRLHGNVADHSRTALLLIDVINPFDFPEADEFLVLALPAAREIGRLRLAARRKGIPVIYANDNFGRWRSNFNELVRHCLKKKGASIVRRLMPARHDYFVLKPKNSAFYTTSLDLLLQHIGVRNLLLTGFAGNNCVLFTANDAYMRDYRLTVPCDCVASLTAGENDQALRQMKRVLKADTRPWRKVPLKKQGSSWTFGRKL